MELDRRALAVIRKAIAFAKERFEVLADADEATGNDEMAYDQLCHAERILD